MSYIPDPITRKEHYMSYLTGNTKYYPKDPITREEQYLFFLCENGGIGGGVTPEQIQAAVDAYLEENPPSGMTPEQIQELDGKLDSDQGEENSGKVLGIGADGNVIPVEQSGGGGTVSVEVESTTTGYPGTDASVENVGTDQQVKLAFTIPRGPQGPTGPQGETGPQGPEGPQGPAGDSGIVSRQEMQNTDTTVTLEPNKLYVFPEMSSLTVTLGTPTDSDVANEYHFFFTSGATATTLTLNDVLSDAYSIEANTKYEVSILEGVAYIKGVAISAA